MELLLNLLLTLPLVGAFTILAIGIVLIYRASKVLNLAHGVMATAPAFAAYSLAEIGVPRAAALVAGVVLGGALGWLVERSFVRPFRRQGATAQTVGTVVVLGLGIALMGRGYGSTARQAVRVFPDGYVSLGYSSVSYGQIGLILTMLVSFGGLLALFKYTELGLLMRGAAENPRAAALMGVNPQRMTALTWILGGALAAVAGIELAAVTVLQPYTLPLLALPAFLAALIGGLESVSGALVGGLVVGVVYGLVPLLPVFSDVQGSAQLFLAVVGLVAMASRGQRLSAGDVRTGLQL